MIGVSAAAGLALSIATSLKSVALPAAMLFFFADGVALLLARPADGRSPARWFDRLKPWLLRGVVVAVAAAPLLGVLARVCTHANEGRFCVTGNKMGSDFLLGHYGRVADIEWRSEGHDQFRFGSPGALLRHYDEHASVPFSMTDGERNKAEAWRWIGKHPGEAIVLSLDHIYDTFFGASAWPTFNSGSWPYTNLSQYAFIIFLFVPTVLACARLAKRGWRPGPDQPDACWSLAPIVALTIIVAIATGEVRYRIPFDIFFIVIACAYVVGDLARADGLARWLTKMPDRPSPRGRAPSSHSPWLWVALVYACGLAVRAIYTFRVQPPEQFITSDMFFYVSLAQKFAAAHGPVDPWDVTHPLGYPALIAFLLSGGGSLARVVNLQLVVSALVPPAVGFLAAAAYGRRTAQLAVMFASLYFPFIEYGALFLSEIHFILWLTLSFAVLFAAHHVRRRAVAARARGRGRRRAVRRGGVQVGRPAGGLLDGGRRGHRAGRRAADPPTPRRG